MPGEIASAAFLVEGRGEALHPLASALREFESEYLRRALALTDGQKARAAKILGISRKNLWEKLRAHGISDSDAEELTDSVR